MTLQTIQINGVPLENYGAVVTDMQDWLSVPQHVLPTMQLPLKPGLVPLTYGATVDVRLLTTELLIEGTSLTDARTKLSTLAQALRGELQIVTVDDPTKMCYGYLAAGLTAGSGTQPAAKVTTFGVPLLAVGLIVAPSFICYDPFWYDVTPQSLTIAAPNTAYTVPMGSERMRRTQITIAGPWAGAVAVVMKNGSGTELQRMTLTPPAGVTVATGDTVVIDNDAYTVTYTPSGGSATSALGWLGTNDTFLAFDPADSPTVTFAVGSGTATGSMQAWRTWAA